MFIPQKQKFKKQQKGKSFNRVSNILNLNNIKFGTFGLKATNFGRLTSSQLKSMYQSINKIIKKTGKIVIPIFPQTPVSKKPIEVRMGKGKGNIDHWIVKVKAGTTLCEIETFSFPLAIKALNFGKIKLPIKTKIFYQI